MFTRKIFKNLKYNIKKINFKVMIKFKNFLFFLGNISLIIGCNTNTNYNTKQDIFVKYYNPQLEYSGRIDSIQRDGAAFHWMGNSVKINFEGESLYAELKDESDNNYFNVILDDNNIKILKTDTTRRQHLLASGLSEGKHTIELFKRSYNGTTIFYGFQINRKSKILPKSSPKKREIIFYGNSITAGSAVEDYSGNDSGDSTLTNNYYSYAAVAARHFNAKYTCISKSGIGIMISWFPLIMPEMYNRLNPYDSTSRWNFINDKPDIVVINLFQNDSWLVEMPEHPQFKARFGEQAPNDDFIINAYKDFVSIIRNHYPKSHIICILGNMDATSEGSKWPDYIRQAVNALNDEKIYTHFIPFKGTSGHPNIEEQGVLANSLIQFIENRIEW